MQTQNITNGHMNQSMDFGPIMAHLQTLEKQHKARGRAAKARLEQSDHGGRANGYGHARYILRRTRNPQNALRRLAEAVEYHDEYADELGDDGPYAVHARATSSALKHSLMCVRAAAEPDGPVDVTDEFAELYAWVDAQPPATDEARTEDELWSMRQEEYEASAPLAQWQQ